MFSTKKKSKETQNISAQLTYVTLNPGLAIQNIVTKFVTLIYLILQEKLVKLVILVEETVEMF